MTTQVNARRSQVTSHWCKAFALLTAVVLGGCESSSSLFGANSGSEPATQIAAPQAAPQPAYPRVAIAPVVGAPDAVGKQLASDISSAVALQKVSVVPATESVDHTLRGYIVAARDRAGVKVSYIWDVTDPQGRRTNRITGEEVIKGADSKDPWGAVSPAVSQAIAQKTAASLGTWIASQAPPPQAQQPAVAGLATPGATQAVANAGIPAVTPAVARSGLSSAAATSTSSLRSNVTMVAPLQGAPGDGNTALASAIKAELAKNGISMTSQPASAYRVEGVVVVGSAQGGKQPIQIDWNVVDPAGKKLGTVTQKNEIPQGSLDGSWGKTADAAAEAAAQGIIKLLPPKGTN